MTELFLNMLTKCARYPCKRTATVTLEQRYLNGDRVAVRLCKDCAVIWQNERPTSSHILKGQRMEKMIVLKLDGEIWECSPGWSNDDSINVGGVTPISPRSRVHSDRAALAKGITHRQGSYGGIDCHEVRKLGEAGDGQTWTASPSESE